MVFSDISMKRPRKRTHKMWARYKGKTPLKTGATSNSYQASHGLRQLTNPGLPAFGTSPARRPARPAKDCSPPFLPSAFPHSFHTHPPPPPKTAPFLGFAQPACLCPIIRHNLLVKLIRTIHHPGLLKNEGEETFLWCLSSIQGLKKKRRGRGSRSEAGAEAFPSSEHKGCLRLPPSDSAHEGPALLQGPLHTCRVSLLDPGAGHAASSKSPRTPKATGATDPGPRSCSRHHPLHHSHSMSLGSGLIRSKLRPPPMVSWSPLRP